VFFNDLGPDLLVCASTNPLLVLNKTHSEKLPLKRHGQFVADLIAYAFVGVSFSDAKFMGGEYLN